MPKFHFQHQCTTPNIEANHSGKPGLIRDPQSSCACARPRCARAARPRPHATVVSWARSASVFFIRTANFVGLGGPHRLQAAQFLGALGARPPLRSNAFGGPPWDKARL